MSEIKELEIRDHEFVGQLQRLLDISFSDLRIGFKIKYFIGVNPKDMKLLCLSIDTRYLGNIYFKCKEMKPYEIPSDVEEDFINEVVNDLLTGGCTFLYVEKGKLMQVAKNKWKSVRELYYYPN